MIAPRGVRLRSVKDTDLPIFLAHQEDPVAAAMASFPTRAPDAFYAHWATIRADLAVVNRTIIVDDTVVGNIGSWLVDGHREVGYWIAREGWGRGYATEALRLLLVEITERPITGHVAIENVGSRRVLEHCGFVQVREEVADDGVLESIMRLD